MFKDTIKLIQKHLKNSLITKLKIPFLILVDEYSGFEKTHNSLILD